MKGNMSDSTQLAAPQSAAPTAHMTTIVSRTGKSTGTRFVFSGTMTAREVKGSLQKADPQLKGAALAKKVNEVLTGTTDIRWATFGVFISAARSDGFVPDSADLRAKSGSIKLLKPKAAQAPKLDKAAVSAMSAEERASLLALLME